MKEAPQYGHGVGPHSVRHNREPPDWAQQDMVLATLTQDYQQFLVRKRWREGSELMAPSIVAL